MKVMTPEEGWDWLVKKTRRWPLLAYAAAPRQGLGGMVIGPPLWSRMLGVGVVLALGIGGIVLPFPAARIAGVAITLAAVWSWFYRLHVLCDPYGRTLTVVRGAAGLERVVVLPRDKLELTRAVIGAAEDGGDSHPAGRQVLQLSHLERPGVVDIMLLPAKPELPPPARALTEFFADRMADATCSRAELADGTALEVPMGPTAFSCGAMPMEPTLLTPDHWVFSSPFLGGLPRAVLAAAAGILLSVGMGVFLDLLPGIIFEALLIFGVGGAIYVFLFVLGSTRFGADLQNGVLYVEGFRRTRRRAWPLSDVAGVQLCAFHVDDAPPGALWYETNLVLRPGAERVRIWASSEADLAMHNARMFAEFIGKPLWDHT